ncbi:hypothetical protein Fmac_001582 [Flemingia macrophylla]|uniref:Uncharacterized protein n=1 Tax=Flemingia macrophylla TaxID=520843 RepID=A0ABD1NIS9_9FABA
MSRFWLNADYVKCIHASGELFSRVILYFKPSEEYGDCLFSVGSSPYPREPLAWVVGKGTLSSLRGSGSSIGSLRGELKKEEGTFGDRSETRKECPNTGLNLRVMVFANRWIQACTYLKENIMNRNYLPSTHQAILRLRSLQGTYITRTVLGITVRIDIPTIAQAIGCECVKNAYHKEWVLDAGGITNVGRVLMRDGESGTILYNKLDDKAKVF